MSGFDGPDDRNGIKSFCPEFQDLRGNKKGEELHCKGKNGKAKSKSGPHVSGASRPWNYLPDLFHDFASKVIRKYTVHMDGSVLSARHTQM
jgi:hypothetical protein